MTARRAEFAHDRVPHVGVLLVNLGTPDEPTPAAVRKYLAENPSKFDPRDWLKPAREAATLICKARFLSFGCEGQAAKIKPIPLEKMAERYKAGELAQIVN